MEGLKTSVKNPEQFLSITYQKAVSVLDKIQSRNTDAMQKLYREAFQRGDGTQGFDLLKRTTDAVGEATAIVNFVAGLHDPEASYATFEVALSELRGSGVNAPDCVDKLLHARKLKELAKASEWTSYIDELDIQQGLTKIFSNDGTEMGAVLDFQASSMISTLQSVLIQEIKVDNVAADAPKTKEEAEKLDAERKTAETKRGLQLTKSLHAFLKEFLSSSVGKLWEEQTATQPCLADIKKICRLAAFALTPDDEKLTSDVIEEVKSCRSTLMQSKKNIFYEPLTLYPLGIFIQQGAVEKCKAFYQDKGLATQLEEVLQVQETLKAFTCDALIKEKPGATPDSPSDVEIVIPNQSKVCDMVSKFQLIETTASARMKAESKDEMDTVRRKIKELHMALVAASAAKFQKKVGEQVSTTCKALMEKKIDGSSLASHMATIGEAAVFMPCAKVTMTKAQVSRKGAGHWVLFSGFRFIDA